MKNKFLSLLFIVTAALVLHTLTSCSGIFSVPDTPDEQGTKAAQEQRYTISGSFSLPNASAAPAEVNAFQNQSNPRNAMPDTSGLTYGLTYIVKAENPDGHEESTISTDHKTYLLDNLTAGNWQITAYATNPSTGVTVMRSETESVSISAESPYASANLTMAPESGSGSIDLSVNWDSNSGIGYCTWEFAGDLANHGASDTPSTQITVTDISSGSYQLELNFYTSESYCTAGAKPLYSCTEYVAVYPSLTTSQWTNGSAPHLTSGFNITKQCVETFVYRRIYVSQTGNDTTGTGTSERPFATIEKAMNRLSEVATLNVTKDAISATTPWELHVIGCPTPPSGSISGNGLIVATNAIKFLKIVGDGDGAKIDANGKGRILYVYNSAKVSMQNIELTNGSSGSGSGVHVLSGGSFTMESGSITSCTTSGGGGGIYSLGNLTIQGGSISGNTANGGAGGGVLAMDGTLNITGGSIKGNTASSYGNNILITSTSITNLPAGNDPFYDDNTSPANGRADAVCQASGHCFMRFNKPNATQNSIDSGINGFNDDATIYLGQTTDSADLTWKSNTKIASSCTRNLTIKPTKDGRAATIQYYNTSESTDYLIHFNKTGKTLTLTNLILDGNSKKCGIVKLDAGRLDATNCTFQNGKAENGGGLNVAYSTTATLTSCTVQNCRAESNSDASCGGGIFTRGTVNFNGTGTIQSCSVSGMGGGVLVANVLNASFNMSGGTISSCSAEISTATDQPTGLGGGVYSYSTFDMSGGTITGCTAATNGAGVAIIVPSGSLASSSVFKMSGDASVATNNEVYLSEDQASNVCKITITGDINSSVAAKIKPSDYTLGVQVLSGTSLATYYSKFAVADYLSTPYYISKEGEIWTQLPAASYTEVPSAGSSVGVKEQEDFEKIAEWVNAGNDLKNVNIYLLRNITLDSTFTPIGSEAKVFSGTFDGMNNKITYSGTTFSNNYSGLFAATKDATLKNIKFEGSLSITARKSVGCLAGYIEAGTVENCTNNVNMTLGSSTEYFVGGLIGQSTGSGSSPYSRNCYIKNCTNNGSISAENTCYVGGIIGDGTVCKITGCTNTGNVTGAKSCGGIIGSTAGAGQDGFGCLIEACTNSGNIEAKGTPSDYTSGAGGIAGGPNASNSDWAPHINNCSSTGTITAKDNKAGGIFGYKKDRCVLSGCTYSGASKACMDGTP